MSEYKIFAIYNDETRTLTGTVDFDYYNNTDNEITDLKFNLYGNAFRENAKYKPVSETYRSKAYYAGLSYGGMQIGNVENCAGWTVGGEDENILTVNLLSSVYPEERVQIKISYTLTLALVNHRTGVTADSVNLGNFYPVLCAYGAQGFAECPYYSCGDPFMSDCANYRVTLDMPDKYTAATSGTAVSERSADGRKVGEYALNGARDFAIVLSDKFQVAEGAAGDTKVTYYYISDSTFEKSLKAAVDSLYYFSDTFGDYAYPTLSVVQTGFCYGGMEYPALTMIAKGLDADTNIYTIVHENAHQWWCEAVGSDQIANAWQDEGLAEYSCVMFFEATPDYGFTRTGIVKQATDAYRAFFTVYNQLNGSVNTAMTRSLADYSGEFEYTNVTYNKGLILFETLRTSVGDEKFKKCLRGYYKSFSGKIATADDLCGCFIDGGTDVEGFFKAFLEGKIII